MFDDHGVYRLQSCGTIPIVYLVALHNKGGVSKFWRPSNVVAMVKDFHSYTRTRRVPRHSRGLAARRHSGNRAVAVSDRTSTQRASLHALTYPSRTSPPYL
ncbi:hypothetical protein FA95DRAFT_1567750 [Auriscalpium vulgare]|uniref:Uncharacterized protein n=1 Tax=Auriscalpium vulgare TaxID=40419 RepID=A0ACB8R2U4_9AGAM|nr:hypothetical protein FA95DRAFT_1567750 [Auriscalpium vulgare]